MQGLSTNLDMGEDAEMKVLHKSKLDMAIHAGNAWKQAHDLAAEERDKLKDLLQKAERKIHRLIRERNEIEQWYSLSAADRAHFLGE